MKTMYIAQILSIHLVSLSWLCGCCLDIDLLVPCILRYELKARHAQVAMFNNKRFLLVPFNDAKHVFDAI